jgi:hypothetical protein
MIVRNASLGRDPIGGRDMTGSLLGKDDLMGYCIIYSHFLSISEYNDLIQVSNFEDQTDFLAKS